MKEWRKERRDEKREEIIDERRGLWRQERKEKRMVKK